MGPPSRWRRLPWLSGSKPTLHYYEIRQPHDSNDEDPEDTEVGTEAGVKLFTAPAWRSSVVSSFLAGFASASAMAGAVLVLLVLLQSHTRSPSSSSSYFTFTSSWAGVIISSPPPKQLFSAAMANLTIPQLNTAQGGTVSVWVGIDVEADEEHPSGVRAGVTITSLPDGTASVVATYQWGADGPHTYSKLGSLSAGDVVQLEVVMRNGTVGKAEVHNFTTGRKATKFWEEPVHPGASSYGRGRPQLPGQKVAWILEDPSQQAIGGRQGEQGGIVTSSSLGDFGRLMLHDCIAWTDKDELLTADWGEIVRIRQNDVARTGVHIEDAAVYFTFIE